MSVIIEKIQSVKKPMAYGVLTDEEFNALIDISVKSCEEAKCAKIEDFKKSFTVDEGL